MQRDGRRFTVEVTADGEGLVSHAGSALLAQVADKTGLSEGALGRPARAQAAPIGPRRRPRRARPLRDALRRRRLPFATLRAVREQAPLFGAVASDSTAFRVTTRSPQRVRSR